MTFLATKKYKTLLSLFILPLIIILNLMTSQIGFAATKTAAPKATATLAASCQIQAFNVNFGVLNLSTSSSGVSASSSMNLFCSKGAAYSVALTFSHANYYIYQGCPTGCPSNQAQYNLYGPSGNLISVNFLSNNTSFINTNFGQLLGAVSGQSIQYKITLPGDDTKLWSTGNYNYPNTGTGASQSFPIKASITTTSYPTPDTYSDNVIATVTF